MTIPRRKNCSTIPKHPNTFNATSINPHVDIVSVLYGPVRSISTHLFHFTSAPPPAGWQSNHPTPCGHAVSVPRSSVCVADRIGCGTAGRELSGFSFHYCADRDRGEPRSIQSDQSSTVPLILVAHNTCAVPDSSCAGRIHRNIRIEKSKQSPLLFPECSLL